MKFGEYPRIRDGELRFTSGNQWIGFFARVNLMHREKKISFQIIINKDAQKKYDKMLELIPEIKGKVNLEFKEESTVNNRTDKVNHCFNYSYILDNVPYMLG